MSRSRVALEALRPLGRIGARRTALGLPRRRLREHQPDATVSGGIVTRLGRLRGINRFLT